MTVQALPVTERREDILAALRAHQVVVVAGETGSGKSTQLPQLCLEAGRERVAHTQPRRIAARTIAERVAEELGTTVGGLVGYAVRFTDQVGPDTRIKVMTDGLLLAETRRDRNLRAYDTVIVDEAHERSLNVDFLLGYLKQLLPRRPDLKVIITSATIDTGRFAEHFDAPVIEVSGRTYPVEVRYRPADDDQTQGIVDAVHELTSDGRGDILVFLSGEREIRDTADALRGAKLRDTEVLPLYARLTAAEQHRVFEAHTGRRIVLATNVAETSLTVPGIRYVIDPGTARISRFNRRTKVQRLPIEPISQASANQRAGRCGRVGPGICIRLYDEDDFAKRPEFTDPEILRTNLASVILQMAAARLGDIEAFPFLDPPDRRAVRDGIALLEELGALDGDRLTKLGRRLADLPLDPRLGRMVLEGERLGCAHEVMVIAAALSIQDPREDGAERGGATSDFIELLDLWDRLRAWRKELGSSQFRRRCRTEHLHWLRVREWQDVYSQLLHTLRDRRAHVNRERAAPDVIHRALLTGLLSHVGLRIDEGREYRGARGTKFVLSPASSLAAKRPRWVMAAELVETNRLWAHTAARVRPEWIEDAAPHLVTRTYADPYWDRRRGSASVREHVSLYGLPIVSGRSIPLQRVDPALARRMFIHHALVLGDWTATHDFIAANRKLLDEAHELAERARRLDVVAGEDELFAFFDERVPEHVTSARHFDRWWRGAGASLTFPAELLLRGGVVAGSFPDTWDGLALSYVFAPGTEDDGVTVDVPVPRLATLDAAAFAWHVPGYRFDVVAALLRGLPKPLRRNVTPVADAARAFLAEASPPDGPLPRALARFAGVDPRLFGLDDLPDHLRIRFRAVSGDRVLAVGRDLEAVRHEVDLQARRAVRRSRHPVERANEVDWTFGELPRTVDLDWRGLTIVAYPAVVDEGDHVAVRLFPSDAEQRHAMRRGLRRLLLLTIPSPRKVLHDRLARRTLLAVGDALDDCIAGAVDSLIGDAVWDGNAFTALRDRVRRELPDRAIGVAAAAGRILTAAHDIDGRLSTLVTPGIDDAIADIHVQLARLVHPGFVTATGARRLPDVLRYLQAIERRIDKLVAQPGRDHDLMRRVRALDDALVRVRRHDDMERIRWLIEELRVSLWAQQLGTAEKVSEQRVLREIEAAAR